MLRRTLLTVILPALASCSPTLGMFDTLAPRDAGARRVLRDEAYGTGARQALDVYAPREADGLPVMIFFYGGAWNSGSKDDYEWLGAAFAAQGFVTVIADYRLVPEVVFPEFLSDCASAVRWVQDNIFGYGGDATKLVMSGHSAGAYNAMMLALAPQYLNASGVDAHRVRGAVGLAGPYDFLPFDVDATRTAFGRAPDPTLTQPVHFVRAEAPPMLLLWGEDDATVGRRSLDNLARAQRAVGGNVETKTYAGVDHIDILLALSRPFRGRAPVLDDVTAFARRVTG